LCIFFNIFKKFVVFNPIRLKVIIFSDKKCIRWISHLLESQLHIRLFLNFFLKCLHFIFVWQFTVLLISCSVLTEAFIVVGNFICILLRKMRRLLCCLIECYGFWISIMTIHHIFFVYWVLYIEVTWCFAWN
jgi:hypothetical protein